MNLQEFLTETGNNVAPFQLVNGDDELWEILSPDIGLAVYLVRAIGSSGKMDSVIIEFTVHGEYKKTGTGNAFQIFSTVDAILTKYLKGYLQRSDKVVTFGADKSEPSRVKLYRRMAPKVSQILGPEWMFGSPEQTAESQQKFIWTRKAALNEKKVQSTWITDLRHSRQNKELTMTLNNGRQFLIPGVTRTTFEQWTRAPSKGRYFHNRIKGKYQVTRTK